MLRSEHGQGLVEYALIIALVAVDAEFFALRRSRSFLMQHLAAFAFLMIPIYGVLLSAVALLDYFGRKLLPTAALRAVALPVVLAVPAATGRLENNDAATETQKVSQRAKGS